VSSEVKPILDELWKRIYTESLKLLKFCHMWEISVLEIWNDGLNSNILGVLTPELHPYVRLFFSTFPGSTTNIHKTTLLPRSGDKILDEWEQSIFLDYWHCLLKWAAEALTARDPLVYPHKTNRPVPRLGEFMKTSGLH
jgi:hypothetical protein